MIHQPLHKHKDAQASIREKATVIFDELDLAATSKYENGCNTCTGTYDSWIRGECECECTPDHDHDHPYPSKRCEYFDLHGFLKVPSFANESEIAAMKKQMHNLVEKEWHPNDGSKKPTVFRTDDKQIEEQGSDDYFLESSNKVHFFAESSAMTSDGKLKEEFLQDKISALNKAGHGMHVRPGAFHEYTTSKSLRALVEELGWVDPVVPQSMYIFKQKKVGGAVTSHQDSTFLYTTPKQTCLGLWLALDDATITNGCLWVRPGSHREKTRVKFSRNPEHFGQDIIRNRSNIAKGDTTKSQMIFIDEPTPIDANANANLKPIDWVGKVPDGCDTPWDSLFEAGFVPVECKAGDLVVFPGELDHLSLENTSETNRHTFQLHLVEGDKAGVTWADTNWLQYPKGTQFLRI